MNISFIPKNTRWKLSLLFDIGTNFPLLFKISVSVVLSAITAKLTEIGLFSSFKVSAAVAFNSIFISAEGCVNGTYIFVDSK